MPVEWNPRIVAPFFKGKSDIWNCSFYEAVELLVHGMKVMEWVLKKASYNSACL